MSESPRERPFRNSDPVRERCTKQYWASIQRWAEQRGMTKEEAHSRFKEQLGFKHLSELKIAKLSSIAYEIGVIADGGAGL